MTHRRFDYKTEADLKADLYEFGLELPLSNDVSCLAEPITIGKGTAPNRLVIQPMEGCDAKEDGSPDEWTLRRYKRFAAGGAGLIWVEATAVVPDGRANPRQLWIHDKNLPAFRRLVFQIDSSADQKPYKVLQLTHSGRYARPYGQPAPQAAALNPILDQPLQKPAVLSDEQLEALIPAYVKSAALAWEAGFDAVDIKACHGYLLNELLSARTRPGRYGGSLENRSRLLLEIVQSVKASVPIDLAVRLNAYDDIPYPYGWGVQKEDEHLFDPTEPHWLIEKLKAAGVVLMNITGGNPYDNPHVNRPYDTGFYKPPCHPLFQITKLLDSCRILRNPAASEPQRSNRQIRFVSSGLSWLRWLAGPVAGGLVREGWCDLVGFGREAFAYPDFAHDLLSTGRMDEKKCCLTCSKCTEIMRGGGRTGCVIRDASLYLPIYQKGRADKTRLTGEKASDHV